MIRRYGKAPAMGRRFVHRPGVYGILQQGSALLLTLQSDPTPEFQLPGGGIDPGESPIAALHREVFEETGWRIAAPRRLGAFRRFTFMPEYDIWAEKVCHIYLARPVRPHGAPTEPGHAAVWLDGPLAVEALANPGDAAFVARVIGR
ncbi:NUDIX hydrolase [Oceaniglobus trochenteri]|uniref:NUDIX hydrolase n=1 Tax=Oceaniglobus trochenteri TaxID=2763260 RepID=UPI001CFF6875|nr:NUDIX hydrolase [Oceaniglobus trochenteri]